MTCSGGCTGTETTNCRSAAGLCRELRRPDAAVAAAAGTSGATSATGAAAGALACSPSMRCCAIAAGLSSSCASAEVCSAAAVANTQNALYSPSCSQHAYLGPSPKQQMLYDRASTWRTGSQRGQGCGGQELAGHGLPADACFSGRPRLPLVGCFRRERLRSCLPSAGCWGDCTTSSRACTVGKLLCPTLTITPQAYAAGHSHPTGVASHSTHRSARCAPENLPRLELAGGKRGPQRVTHTPLCTCP